MSLRKVSKESLDENKPCLGDEQCVGSPVQSTAEVGHGRDRVVDVVLAQEQAEVVAEVSCEVPRINPIKTRFVFFQELSNWIDRVCLLCIDPTS